MADSISILDGSSFAVSDLRGDMIASADLPHGFFHRDTRFLSRWRLMVGGVSPDILSTDDADYFAAQFFLAPTTGTIYRNPYLSVIRHRVIGEQLVERVTVLNHAQDPVSTDLRLDVEADFADLFEVKDLLDKAGTVSRTVKDSTLLITYRREGYSCQTQIDSSQGCHIDGDGFQFALELEPNSKWETIFIITPLAHDDQQVGTVVARKPQRTTPRSVSQWVAEAPTLTCDWDELEHIYRQSLIDLAALRFSPDGDLSQALPAAGLPWFMALFGRDSLIASYQALPFFPSLARATLRVLADRQGQKIDAFRDEEPGRILHELRFGELTFFGERPHSPYFGTTDATPLFLVLLDEYERWSGDRELISELEPAARACLTWIDSCGDRDGDGYVEYERRNIETGLENQCWKDSWNSILFADGRNSSLPRATCEIQGYVYDAKVRCARLAREVWDDDALGARLVSEAAELKTRFNRDFWLSTRQHFALALDGDKQPVDSLTSNIGHLLWSGIVSQDHAQATAEALMGPRLFSGWGVRTMAEGDRGYNPIEYHNGTVWPHDNSLIAAGLARYGFRAEAARVAQALCEAATYFHYRLPEAFAGYDRAFTSFPVRYPTASSPQAWATGAPLLFLRTILGLEPREGTLVSNPVLPSRIGAMSLTGIPGRWKSVDVAVTNRTPRR